MKQNKHPLGEYMAAPLTIYIMRHGEVHNPENILYGRLPNYHLSEVGRGQASAAAHVLSEKKLAAIYASPLERAQETASIIAAAQKDFLSIKTDERLIEVHTPYDGTSIEELEKINFDLYTETEAPYEQVRDLRRRLLNFLNEMREKYSGQEIAAVTHGDIVVSAFMYALRQDENDIGRTKTQSNRIEALGLPEVYPATASISKLIYHSDNLDEVPEYSYQRPY
jgi:broad specificity phosphatase PhoE